MKRKFEQRWGGWLAVPLRALVVLLIWSPAPLAVAGVVSLSAFASRVPDSVDITRDVHHQPSHVRTETGWELAGPPPGGPIELHSLPPEVIAAFLAAEDATFFEHRAFSTRAIARAAVANFRTGERTQGASTITQQVARRFLSREKTFRRKVEELLLARRIEAEFSKTEILEAYLNEVYFGQQAYGLSAAARIYFDKSPEELSVEEAAVLAGLLPAPSVFNPVDAPDASLRERNEVLRKMERRGMLSPARTGSLVEKPVELRRWREPRMERAPYVVEGARSSFAAEFDDEAWREGGYEIVVAHEPTTQALARRALRRGVEAHDRRQGWRGPLARVTQPDAVDAALGEQIDRARFVGRIDRVDREEAIAVVGDASVELELAESSWAAPATRERHYKRPAELEDFREVLAPDDLVLLERIGEGRARLAQFPGFEGATILNDSRSGRTRASVGGYDADRNLFHRARDGCRQPGSVFKPVVYAEALSQGLTPATLLSDLPREFSTGTGEVWTPRNADRDFKGFVLLANALAWSRNIPTVYLMEHVGIPNVVARGEKLGIESKLDRTSSVSLGASCVRPVEVARVFSSFQRGGATVEIAAYSHIRDQSGDIIRDRGEFSWPSWSTAARLDRMARIQSPPSYGVSRQVAYLMWRLLRRVVTSGTAHELPDDWFVAGKTGTTNEFDAWFVGFDGRVTSVSWVGSDKNERSLGRGEHGATVALPVFEHLYGQLQPRLVDDVEVEPVDGVVTERVDAETGLLARPGEPAIELPFLKGTVPTELAPTRGTRQAEQFDQVTTEF
ncbi:MAG: penicillin-binding protein 1A [Myxococcota bacterium]